MAGDDMRAADTDRQQVADRLRAALEEGRLDLHEYDERLQRTYIAKTYGDLDALLVDLPVTVPLQRSQMAPAAAASPEVGGGGRPREATPRLSDATTRWLLQTWLSYITVLLVLWAVAGAGSSWPVWVAVPWGVVLIGRTVSGLSNGEPRRWAEKKDREARKRAQE